MEIKIFKKPIRLFGQLAFFVVVLSCSGFSFAGGVIQMPEVEQVPDYENESMLLDLDVPNVRERDPDPEAGPRLNVKEFRLQGLVEYPELGISREELIRRVESIRFDLMEEGEFTDSGYTLDELGELSDLIADIEKDTETEHVGSLEVQKLVFLIREQRRKRGITLGMIETVADTITLYYREKGFILAKAYIPKQRVRDGIVTLTLLLGELGELSVSNNKRLSDKHVQRVFRSRLNQPVTESTIEESLYLLNDTPGVTARGFFEPGSQVGDTKLNVNLLSEKWYTANLRVDNHGSAATSENRVYADFLLNNPLGIGDQLYFSILNGFSPNNSTYGAVRYNTFLFSPRWRYFVGFSTNDFVSSQIFTADNSPLFTGESTVFDTGLKYIFQRSRLKNRSASLSFFDISTELDSAGGFTDEQESEQIKLSYDFDNLNQRSRTLLAGQFALKYSDNQTPSLNTAESEGTQETIFSYELTRLSFPNFPFTDYQTRLVLKSSGQYSGESLVNLNQVSLAGPDSVRGFEVNGFQADDGIYLGADWIFSLPKWNTQIFGESIGRIFQPFVFVDGAYGVVNDIASRSDLIDDDTATDLDGSVNGTLVSAGIGLKFRHSNLFGSLNIMTSIVDDLDSIQAETPTAGILFDIQYTFN